FAHLLQTSLPIKGYISLCGFNQFCATPTFASGVSSRLVTRMITQFQKSPAQVLTNFYQQCGIKYPILKTIHKERLAADLHQLLTLYHPLPDHKFIGALGGEDDLITPLSMQKHLFKNLIILKKSGHLPWLKDARNCARYIQTLVEGKCHNDQTTSPS
ncbi:MAG TPA: hypothetical protein VNJ29_02045, partial [Candidatus Nitrosotenuis sp.]|nr:hypothetical protein [Candidatus Nitrosotenuis sp.]